MILVCKNCGTRFVKPEIFDGFCINDYCGRIVKTTTEKSSIVEKEQDQ